MHRKRQYRGYPWGTICLLSAALLAASTALAFFPGCTNSRDSGSTVTGRALRFPIGNPLPFVRVLVKGENALRLQVTDSNGSFTMFHVPTGTYNVRFARFGVELYSQPLVIDQNDTTYVVHFPDLASGNGRLSGAVEDDLGPVVGAEVWVLYSGGGVAYGVSNLDGAYEVPGLPAGEVVVVCEARGHLTRVYEGVSIGAEGVTELDIELEVRAAYNGGTVLGVVRTVEGEVLKDAYVGIFHDVEVPSLFMIAERETLSTESGYVLPNIPAGKYTVICMRSGYALRTQSVVVEEFGIHRVDFVLDSEEKIWRTTNVGDGSRVPNGP